MERMKYGVLKVKELYNRWMYIYCLNKSKKFESEKNFKEMYIWKGKSRKYSERRKQLLDKIWDII